MPARVRRAIQKKLPRQIVFRLDALGEKPQVHLMFPKLILHPRHTAVITNESSDDRTQIGLEYRDIAPGTGLVDC